MPTTISGERSTQRPTSDSGPTPRLRRWRASGSARRVELAVGEPARRPRGLDGGSLRGPRRLRREQAVDRGLADPRRDSPAPAARISRRSPAARASSSPSAPSGWATIRSSRVRVRARMRRAASALEPGPVIVEAQRQPVLASRHGVEGEREVPRLRQVDLADLEVGAGLPLAQGVDRIVLEHQHGLEEGPLAPHLAPAHHLVELAVLVVALLDLLLLERLEPGGDAASGRCPTRTGSRLMNSPTIDSTPSISGGRPETMPPKTTSCRNPARNEPSSRLQAPCTTVLRVTWWRRAKVLQAAASSAGACSASSRATQPVDRRRRRCRRRATAWRR